MKKLTSYKDKLLDPRWQRKRLEVLSRDKWLCQSCGAEKDTLHIHHEEYQGEPWEAPSAKLSTQCKYCHYLIEKHKGSQIFITRIQYEIGPGFSVLDNHYLYFYKIEDYLPKLIIQIPTTQAKTLIQFLINNWLNHD